MAKADAYIKGQDFVAPENIQSVFKEVCAHRLVLQPKAQLTGTTIDVGNCPDLAPILTVLGMYADGETRLINAARLRDKESDCIEAMETELRKLGVTVSSTHDSMTVVGGTDIPANAVVHGHNDHRIVMSLAIAATLGNAPVIIEDAQAISKSYPDFFDALSAIGGRIEVLS